MILTPESYTSLARSFLARSLLAVVRCG